MAQPGSVAKPGYSDLVRVGNSNIVFNAPIVATGDGPFDVSEAHTNTLDRVMAIDEKSMTVDLQFIRAFSHGKDIFYFTFGSTGDLHIAEWSADVVARNQNFAQTDESTIRWLAARRFITNPGGGKLSSTNFVVNCPVLGFATSPPEKDQAPDPNQ